MPKKRPPISAWKNIRKIIWQRDGGRCVHCFSKISLSVCHIDHIKSGKLATNKFVNLRTLCKRCHVLRCDSNHRGMIAKALNDGVIPPDWRKLVWED